MGYTDDTFIFWTHGISVVPEFTKEYTGHDNGLYMRRAGFGAQIIQKKGTTNWFHFAIPSATKLDNDNVDYYHAWLRCRVNNGAVIDSIHIRQAPGPKSSSPVIYDAGKLNITGQDTELKFDLPDEQCKGPLVMCVHVKFEQDNGEVVFSGAGGWFEELA